MLDSATPPPPEGFELDSTTPKATLPKAIPFSPKSNPRPLAGRAADLASKVIGDEGGYGVSGFAKTASNPILSTAQALGYRGDPSKPLIPTTPVQDAGHPIAQGTADFVGNVVSSLSTPDVLSQLALGGLGEGAAKVVTAGFISQMASDAPDKAAEVGQKLAQGDKRGATSALLGYVLDTLPFGGVIKEGVGPITKSDKAITLAREINKAPLERDPTDFTNPAVMTKQNDYVVGNLDESPTNPEGSELLSNKGKIIPPKNNRVAPVVPETPPEPERDLPVTEEIRQRGLKTKKQIQSLFPHLSNEEATALRKAAWGDVTPPQGATPTVHPEVVKTVQDAAKVLPRAAEETAKQILTKGKNESDVSEQVGKVADREHQAAPKAEEPKAEEPQPEMARPSTPQGAVAPPAGFVLDNPSASASGEEIPLGLNRPVKEDVNLHALSEDDFDKEYRASKKEIYDLEGQWDKDESSVDREKLAAVQDKWSAVDLERFRRNTIDTVPADLMYELRRMADSAATYGPGSEKFEKARIIIQELKRQGASPKDILSEIKLKSPDAAEVFKGQLQDIQKVASQIPPEPIKQLPAPPPEPASALVEVLSPPPKSISVQTPNGIRRVTVSAKMEGGKATVGSVKLHNDKTGAYEIFHPPQGKTFPTLDEAANAGFESVRSKFPEVKQVSPSPEPAKPRQGFKKQIAGVDRPFDAIDAYQSNFGTKKINLKAARKLDKDFKPTGAARRLFSNDGTIQPDEAAEAMAQHGVTGDEHMLQRVNEDAQARIAGRFKPSREETLLQNEEKAYQRFTNDARKKQGKETIIPHDLNEGDSFEMDGHKVKVKELHFDENGEVEAVTLEDGNRYGTQTVPTGSKINVDEGTVKQLPPITEFAPEEKPSAPLPKLRPGEKGTGDLLSALPSEDFALTGQKGKDFDREQTTKEKAAREKAESEKGQEIISMGGLAPSDPNEPVGKGRTDDRTGYGGDIYGVAQRVREAMYQAGRTMTPPKTGKGINPKQAVEWGRELLRNGADPEKALSDFEKTDKISFDEAATVRAHGEELDKAARRIEIKFGTDSTEYRTAQKALNEWQDRSKPIATEAHKQFVGLQGETDIDTGSFPALQSAFHEKTGKDFTASQVNTAKKIATENRTADAKVEQAKEKLYSTVEKPPIDPKVKSLVDRILFASHAQADAARARIKARAFTFSAGVDPTVLADVAIIGADHILTGLDTLGKWSKKMVDEFGEGIRPHLDEIWKMADAKADEITNKLAGKEAPKVKESRKPYTPKTLTETKEIMAGHKPGTKFTDDQMKALWGHVKTYLDKGIDNYGEVRNKVATDLGLPIFEVNRGLTQSTPVKRLADDVWRKQYNARQLKQRAKQWLADQQVPGFQRVARSIPRAFFGAKVFGHGAVALGTHAPMVAFQPQYWKAYLNDYGKMAKMNLSPAFYEMQMDDLVRRPNYTAARRAGLVNDPSSVEDFNNIKLTGFWDDISKAGNRGYSVLKLLRQDMFDQQWDKLHETAQTPEVAQKLADSINHVTGVTKARPPAALNVGLFAPRLEASRIAWLMVDPAKAGATFANWKNASEADKMFAINQVKEKATVFATMASLLAANQAMLSISGSNQKINMTDPMQSDWMKFKGMGMDFSYGNPYITLLRLPVRLGAIREKSGTGKLKNLIYPDESMGNEALKYVRSQLSPFASFSSDIAFKADYANRPLPKMPFSGEQLPVPKRLKAEGVTPYSWKEFLSETALPIPAEEAAREVFHDGFGLDEAHTKSYLKALATIGIMAGTGGRLTDDWTQKPQP